jgi:hypothetical protein
MNNTSNITQTGIARIKIKLYWIPGHCGVEVNKMADSEAKQAIKEGGECQLLLPVAELKIQWRKKGKEGLHTFCKNTKRDREKATLKGTTGMARLRGSA